MPVVPLSLDENSRVVVDVFVMAPMYQTSGQISLLVDTGAQRTIIGLVAIEKLGIDL